MHAHPRRPRPRRRRPARARGTARRVTLTAGRMRSALVALPRGRTGQAHVQTAAWAGGGEEGSRCGGIGRSRTGVRIGPDKWISERSAKGDLTLMDRQHAILQELDDSCYTRMVVKTAIRSLAAAVVAAGIWPYRCVSRVVKGRRAHPHRLCEHAGRARREQYRLISFLPSVDNVASQLGTAPWCLKTAVERAYCYCKLSVEGARTRQRCGKWRRLRRTAKAAAARRAAEQAAAAAAAAEAAEQPKNTRVWLRRKSAKLLVALKKQPQMPQSRTARGSRKRSDGQRRFLKYRGVHGRTCRRDRGRQMLMAGLDEADTTLLGAVALAESRLDEGSQATQRYEWGKAISLSLGSGSRRHCERKADGISAICT